MTIVGWLASILLIYLIRPIAEITANEWLPALIPPLLSAHWSAWRSGYTCVEWLSAPGIKRCWHTHGPLGAGRVWLLHFYPEFVLFILAPFAITGLALVLLLRQGEIAESKKQNAENKRGWFPGLGMLLLIPLFFAGSWVGMLQDN